MILEVRAVTFDDFYTLRYPVEERDDIVCPILKALKRQGLDVDDKRFLRQYFKANSLYRRSLKETFRESLLDDIVSSFLVTCGYKPQTVGRAVKEAVDYGLTTRKSKWFPDAKRTLITLREAGHKLGLISNTHWRFSEGARKELMKYFDVMTLSFEHGYVKPHPSIFTTTLKKLRMSANNCLHVGDDPISDIQGARSVGMKTAFIMRREMRTGADIEIERLIELTALLQKMKA